MNKLWRAPFCRMGVNFPRLLSPLPLPGLSLPAPPLHSPPHSAPPLFSYLSDSSISPLSPPCSCLLIVSEALSLGPPTRLRSEGIAASQGGDWNVKMLSETASTRRDGGHTRVAAPAVSWPAWVAGDLQNGAREGNQKTELKGKKSQALVSFYQP